MNSETLMSNLNQLLQIDSDGVKVYEHALQYVDIPAIYSTLNDFREDYSRHIAELNEIFSKLNAISPQFTKVNGYFTEGFRDIADNLEPAEVFKTIQFDEKLIKRLYTEARNWELPAEVKTIVANNIADGERHLEYLEQVLTSAPWQDSEAPSD